MKREKLTAARYRKGWSQEEAAERVGVTRNTLSLWERGLAAPYPLHCQRLCEIYEKPADELDLEHDTTSQASDQLPTDLAALQAELRQEINPLRRQFLEQLLEIIGAALLTSGNKRNSVEPGIPVEEFLPQCASGLKVCWHLMQSDGLALAEEILAQYLPTLVVLTFRLSKYQETAASLATQAKILQAILAMHRMNLVGREMACHEAIQYSAHSGDSGLIAASKMTLAYTYTYCIKRPEQAIVAYLEALQALGDEVSLLRSDIYMGLASAYAQHREEQEALTAIGQAKEHFPDHPELDPRFLYADCGRAELSQWEGKMYLDLARHYPDRAYSQRAYDAFSKSNEHNAVADRSTSETLIHFAEAALGLGDLEQYTLCLRNGAQLALSVGSKKRFNEAFTVFKQTPLVWRAEPHIQALDTIFYQYPSRRLT